MSTSTDPQNLMDPLNAIQDMVENQYNCKRYPRAAEMERFRELFDSIRKNLIETLLPIVLKPSTNSNSVQGYKLETSTSLPPPTQQTTKEKETYARVVIKEGNSKLPDPSTLENSISKVLHNHQINATLQGCKPTKAVTLSLSTLLPTTTLTSLPTLFHPT